MCWLTILGRTPRARLQMGVFFLLWESLDLYVLPGRVDGNRGYELCIMGVMNLMIALPEA